MPLTKNEKFTGSSAFQAVSVMFALPLTGFVCFTDSLDDVLSTFAACFGLGPGVQNGDA